MELALENKPTQIGTSVLSVTSTINFELAERIRAIRASQLFAGLSIAACAQIAERARTRVFERNEFLFMQGQPFSSVVLVDVGCVKLTQLSANGSEVILAMRGPSEVIDLFADPLSCHHSFAAQAVVRCRTITWNSLAINSLMATMPQISGNICAILAKQLQELQEHYHEMCVERVERRLARTLIRLANKFGTPLDEGIEVSISRQELAQMIGTTLFTVSRTISKWGDLGLVVPRRAAVLILNLERLDLISSRDQEPSHRGGSSLSEHEIDLVPEGVRQTRKPAVPFGLLS
jgi:CRP-like cAMP-binding protein